ncbi:MAG: TAXI family TRAP transporter solute-binding subunit [Candidatus Parabeggiatoa sp.]|nr:TAXI family TRAP transporter solute-binding subunit [Candidatus Parabeggiatoa sp.]
MKFFAKSMLFVVFFVSASFVVAEKNSEKTVITITTASENGFYYKIGKDIQTLVKKESNDIEIRVVQSYGSLRNMQRLSNEGDSCVEKNEVNCYADIGIVQSDVWREKYDKNKVGLILPLYEEEVHLLARSHIKKIEDLKGKQVVIGTTGSGTWFTALNILETLEITAETTSFLEQSEKEGIISVLKGKADAVFYVIGKGIKAFKNFENLHYYQEYGKLDNVHFIKIKLSEKLKDKGYYDGYLKYSWFKNNIQTVAVSAMLVGRNYCHNTDSAVKKIKDKLSEDETLQTLKDCSQNENTCKMWEQTTKPNQQMVSVLRGKNCP